MATPVPPLVPTSAMPLATDSDAAFDAKAFPALASLNPFGVSLEAIAAATADNADAALAAALGGDLPALTGNADKFLRVNAGATAAEFAGAWERGGAPISLLGDFNLLTESGIYTTGGTWANQPPGNVSRTALVISRDPASFNNILQMVTVPTSTTPTIYTRVGTGDPVVWSDWELMITSGNEQQIGVGQTWQNLTASRAVATSYQNTTNKPIFVSITNLVNTTSANNAEVSVDNTTWIAMRQTEGSVTLRSSVSFVVPDQYYYRLGQNSGTTTFGVWAELR